MPPGDPKPVSQGDDILVLIHDDLEAIATALETRFRRLQTTLESIDETAKAILDELQDGD